MPSPPWRQPVMQSRVPGAPAEETGAPQATRTREMWARGVCGAVRGARALGSAPRGWRVCTSRQSGRGVSK